VAGRRTGDRDAELLARPPQGLLRDSRLLCCCPHFVVRPCPRGELVAEELLGFLGLRAGAAGRAAEQVAAAQVGHAALLDPRRLYTRLGLGLEQQNRLDLEEQARCERPDIALRVREDSPVALIAFRVVGVPREEKHGACRRGQAHRASDAQQRIGARVLVQVHERHDRRLEIARHVVERVERLPHRLVAVAVHGAVEVRH
jgi:hypothetical protein